MRLKEILKIITTKMLLYSPANSLKNLLYIVLCGYKIGSSVKIGSGTMLRADHVEIGNGTMIGKNVTIRSLERVIIGDYCSIQEKTIIEGDNELYIGVNCWIGRESIINVCRKVIISDNACIGIRSQLWTHGHFSEVMEGYPGKYGEIVIGRNVWLQVSSIVLPGTTIGENSLVGARSLILKDVPPNVFAFNTVEMAIKSEGEYRKHLSYDDKKNMIINYLNDLFGQYEESEPDKIIWRVHSNPVYLVREINENLIEDARKHKFCLILSMKKIPEKIWNLRNNKMSMFDLESKLCTTTNNKLEIRFRRSANDYLIRFNAIDKINENRGRTTPIRRM